MLLLSAVLHIIFISFLGGVVIRLIARDHDFGLILRCALGYGLGSGIVCQLMLWMAHFNFSYNSFNIDINLFIILSIALLFQFQISGYKIKKKISRKYSQYHVFFLLGWVLLFLAVGSSFLIALLEPIWTWDAVDSIGFIAKVIFYDGGLQNISRYPHAYYPLHVPLLESWLAFGAGIFDGQTVKIIFPVYYGCLLIVAYYFFKFFTTSRWALFGTLLILASDFVFFHATISYRDLTLMYYNFCTVALLLLWMKKKSLSLLILASLFAGMTALVKMEGFLFLFIYFMGVVIIAFMQKPIIWKDVFKKIAFFIFSAYGPFLLFYTYCIKMGVVMGQKTQLAFHWDSLNRVGSVFYKIYSDLFFSANWSLVWMILVLSLLRWRQTSHKPYANMTVLFLCLFFGLIIVYGVFTGSYPWIGGKYSDFALSRIIMHLFPIGVMAIIFLNAPLLENE